MSAQSQMKGLRRETKDATQRGLLVQLWLRQGDMIVGRRDMRERRRVLAPTITAAPAAQPALHAQVPAFSRIPDISFFKLSEL